MLYNPILGKDTGYGCYTHFGKKDLSNTTDDQWSIKHVPREKNQVAGRIVKMASDRIKDVHVFGNIPE
ncbi:hypothetical protein Goari_004651 [Gossypium aridum]|uniref:RNase H type-1 domain-containing protein n=1 Tax=Gossypium aridum TaxID=34290 RepID=A0A7J8Y4X0_GOSAI|nr:hypothetical protein [Gossypium aridum]